MKAHLCTPVILVACSKMEGGSNFYKHQIAPGPFCLCLLLPTGHLWSAYHSLQLLIQWVITSDVRYSSNFPLKRKDTDEVSSLEFLVPEVEVTWWVKRCPGWHMLHSVKRLDLSSLQAQDTFCESAFDLKGWWKEPKWSASSGACNFVLCWSAEYTLPTNKGKPHLCLL